MSRFKKLCLVLFFALALMLNACSPLPKDQSLRVTVINVKHGDCILLQSPSGETMMIDTGNGSYHAQNAIETAMQNNGMDHIDILVLTHPHKDHIGGAAWVLNTYPVGTVYTTTRSNDTDLYRTVQSALADKGLTPQFLTQGSSFSFGPVAVSALSPYDVNDEEINNTSIVLQMAFGQTKLLFMGDAEKAAEETLLQTYGDGLRSTFLKVGHHGIDAAAQEFLQAVQPTVCIVSKDDAEGYSDKKQKKQEKAFEHILENGSKLYRTDVEGTITLTFSQDNAYEVSYTGQ